MYAHCRTHVPAASRILIAPTEAHIVRSDQGEKDGKFTPHAFRLPAAAARLVRIPGKPRDSAPVNADGHGCNQRTRRMLRPCQRAGHLHERKVTAEFLAGS